MLEIDPKNVHALSNLTRFLWLSGQHEAARPWIERLKALDSERVDLWLKKAEALSYVGDDEGVLEAYRGAERAGLLRPPFDEPLLHHLAAVATMRLGRESEARLLWQRALKLQPGFDLAQANLDDLRQPVGERHAPWPFALTSWVTHLALQDLANLIRPAAGRGGDEAIRRRARQYLRQHPEVAALVPLLLDRGDPGGRDFAVRLASLAELPELTTALRDFALGQRGPDDLRLRAAQAASEAGLMPAGMLRFWSQGEWREVLLLSFEIHEEPTTRPSRRIADLHAEALDALHRGDGLGAERLLEQALEREPDDPSLLNNRAAAFQEQGRIDEAEASLRRLFEQHPDYFFARIGMARIQIEAKQYDEARALLEPLMTKRRLHVSEFGALAAVQIELMLAQGNRDAARNWLQFWESADPDNPMLDRLRRQVERGDWRKLLGLGR